MSPSEFNSVAQYYRMIKQEASIIKKPKPGNNLLKSHSTWLAEFSSYNMEEVRKFSFNYSTCEG